MTSLVQAMDHMNHANITMSPCMSVISRPLLNRSKMSIRSQPHLPR
jgi:hypothetical protein